MAIKKHPTRDIYIVSYHRRHPITRQCVSIRRLAKSQAEANRKYHEMIIESEQRFNLDVSPPWSQVISAYILAKRQEGYSEKTLSDYDTSLRAYTEKRWGNRSVNKVLPDEIREVIRIDMKDKSDHHQKKVLKLIRTVMAYAVECGYVKDNPTPKIKVKIAEREKQVLSKAQVFKLLDEAKKRDNPWYPIWALAFLTGMRNGELIALRRSDIDYDRKFIIVRRSWNPIQGYKSTKSTHERKIPINNDLLKILNKLENEHINSDFVLPQLDAWKRGYQSRILAAFLKEIELPKIRFHDLRATFATILLGAGEPPAKVMLVGGWKDMKTMMIYMRKAGLDLEGFGESLRLPVSLGREQ